MKVKRYEGSEEKMILTGMIVHDGILRRLFNEVGTEKNLFLNKWSNQIARWCFAHFKKYHKAPKSLIQQIFQHYSESHPDEESVETLETFLASLSDSYKRLAKDLNEEWCVDLAARHFEMVRASRIRDDLEAAIDDKDVEEIQKIRGRFKPVSFAAQNWFDLSANNSIEDIMTKQEEDRNVVRFPGDLDRFLSPYFERGAFISFAAPEKVGKSFWLLEVIWRALQQRRRVLYYVLGDMSKMQAGIRLYCRATKRPRQAEKGLQVPISIKPAGKNDEGTPIAKVEIRKRDFEAVSALEIKRALKRLSKHIAIKELPLKMRVEGGGVVSASDIERDIQEYTEQNMEPPDLVVIDYADLLAPEEGSTKQDFRHQINETWKILRRIALDNHLCLVTATQAAARSYGSWVLKKKDFSEDKRKNSHVTGMLGINQTPEEKKQGIYRLNWTFLRDGRWTETQYIWCAGNLALACPCLVSSF